MKSMYQNDQELMKAIPDTNSKMKSHTTYSSQGEWFSASNKSTKVKGKLKGN